MSRGAMGLRGHEPLVQVLTPAQRALEARAQDLLQGKRVARVYLQASQLVIVMEDGGEFTMTCDGGFTEVS